MRHFILSAFVLLTSQGLSQPLNVDMWEEESESNNRLLPKYGGKTRTDEEAESDKKFVEKVLNMEQFNGDRRSASNHMIDLGFNYLYRGDHHTAMYRFNQAYLLDSSNVDIYWGFSGFFFTIGHYENSKQQLDLGLQLDSTSAHLLTDMGTYYLAQYYALEPIDSAGAILNLDKGLEYLHKSYDYDPKYESTSFKLSIFYWMKSDCENAWKYYKICKKLKGDLITDAYTEDLKKKCGKKK